MILVFMLQGFPETFKLSKNLSDSELYHQSGNSVTVPVIQRIAENMMVVLNGGRINSQQKLVLQFALPNSNNIPSRVNIS